MVESRTRVGAAGRALHHVRHHLQYGLLLFPGTLDRGGIKINSGPSLLLLVRLSMLKFAGYCPAQRIFLCAKVRLKPEPVAPKKPRGSLS